MTLTRKQREALAMIEQADPGEAYLVVCESFTERGANLGNPWVQAFINFRTAWALEQRGLVRIEGQGEDATVYLTGGSAVSPASQLAQSAPSRDDSGGDSR